MVTRKFRKLTVLTAAALLPLVFGTTCAVDLPYAVRFIDSAFGHDDYGYDSYYVEYDYYEDDYYDAYYYEDDYYYDDGYYGGYGFFDSLLSWF